MDLAALPACPLEVPFHRSHQATMIVAGHQLHAMQTTGFNLAETLLVAGLTLGNCSHPVRLGRLGTG